MDQLPFPAAPPCTHLPAQAAALRRSLEVARVLMRSRAIDLSGIEDEVGRLCAGLLDQPRHEAGVLRHELAALLTTISAILASADDAFPGAR